MGSYFIFALVLTVLYIVYFAVNIIRDLYGKKGTEKTDEEVFRPRSDGFHGRECRGFGERDRVQNRK